ncbi:MAG: transglycosylase domain-containing protein, partial [Candidatus Omnitrophica bacterium]|nr:transglycosylase domain-containing protein [Candidatus Omnitrophota bacterium]
MGSENLRGTGWPPDSEGDLGFWGGPDPGQEGQAAGDLRPPQPPPRVRRPGADPVSTLRYLLSYLYVGCLLTASVMVFFAIGFGWPWLEDHISHLPGIELVNDYRPDLSSQLLSSDGSVVAEFFVERRRKRLARFDDLPKNLVNALIATEDQQFWKHHGINPVRFAKADSLSLGRFWIKRGSVPKAEPRTDDDGRRELADAMSAFFREQGRGHYCRVDHFPRGRLLRISQDAECDGKRSKGSSSRGRCCGAFRFCARG